MEEILIGIDFSMAKPAAAMMFPDKQLKFFAWPEKLTNHAKEAYSSLAPNVQVKSRDVGSLPMDLPNSQRVYAHILRAKALARCIVSDLAHSINGWLSEAFGPLHGDVCTYVATEGLSFGSKGASTLDLATYKGIFLETLVTHFGSRLTNLFTYAPMTIKSVAGCSKSKSAGSKDAMIEAFINEFNDGECTFRDALTDGALKNVKGTHYIECVDDIVDSWWTCQTMLAKDLVAKG